LPANNWTWHQAMGTDVPEIKDLTETLLVTEPCDIFTRDELVFMRNVTTAIVNQYFNPGSELLQVARMNDQIIGYVWAKRDYRMCWSDEEMVHIQMAQVLPSISARMKIQLIREMIEIWEAWTQQCGLKMIVSNTMRHNQTAFLRLHTQQGYDVRGSHAYKRIS